MSSVRESARSQTHWEGPFASLVSWHDESNTTPIPDVDAEQSDADLIVGTFGIGKSLSLTPLITLMTTDPSEDHDVDWVVGRRAPAQISAMGTCTAGNRTLRPELEMTSQLFALTTVFSREAKADWLQSSNVESGIDEMVNQLRDWTGLNATELADLLGVSRRTLYHWVETGGASPENRLKLERVFHSMRALGESWSPVRIRQWLSSLGQGLLQELRTGDTSEFERCVRHALVRPEIPLFRAHRVITDSRAEADPIGPLSEAERALILAAFSTRREGATTQEWIPPELTDSVEYD